MTENSNQKKRIWYLLGALQGMILLLLCIPLKNAGQEYSLPVVFESRTENEFDYISGRQALPKGSYRVLVQYSASEDMTNIVDVVSESASYGTLKTNTTILYAGQHETSHLFWLTEDTEDIQVKVTYGGAGTLEVSGIRLVRTNHRERGRLLYAFLCFLLLDALLFYQKRSRKDGENSGKVMAMLLGIIAVSSLPLLADYLVAGADMTFHLLRIEGVKDALLSGQFPVRIHPNWLQGHGYATGIFYSDLFLYIPAFFRMMGMTVQAAYKSYKLLVNIATCLIAYYSFQKIFEDKMMGVLGSFLYTLSVARLVYLYNVDGVGQYTAMCFMPLVIYGFYRIYTMDVENRAYPYSFIPLTLGLSGLIESHVLSCEMAAFFALLLCLICIRKTLQKKVFLELWKTVGATLLLNLWYLVPFLDYTVSMDLAITRGGATYKQIQTWGMYLPQLFETFLIGGRYGARNADKGMVDETAHGIGLGLTLGLILTAFILIVKWHEEKAAQDGTEEEKNRTIFGAPGKIALAFGLLSLGMATIYFPWDKLAKCGRIFRQLIATLQFSSRMVVPATVFLVFTTCLTVYYLKSACGKEKRKKAVLTGAVICLITGSTLSAMYFGNTQLQESSHFYRLYDEHSMGNSYISGGEYVLLGTDTHKLTYKPPVCSERIALNSYEKKGCYVRLDCDNGTGEGYIELPLLYYKGYRARESGGMYLPVVCGDNNVARVIVPSGFQGIMEVDFHEFWYWRAAEAVSLLTLGLIISLAIKARRAIL